MPRTGPAPLNDLATRAARRAAAAAFAASLAALVLPGGAAAAQRFASPASDDTLGTCSQLAPCRVDWAITGAGAGDEVVIQPGDYTISPISTSIALNVHGVAERPRPRLLSSRDTTAALTLRGATTLTHVFVSASGSSQDALTLQGGTADDVVLVSQSGDGAKLTGAGGGTVLRDSIARAVDGGRALVLKDGNPASGPVELRNVTAAGDGAGSVGVVSQMTHGMPTLRNVVARGVSYDLQTSVTAAQLTAEFSNFRPPNSVGYTAGPGNQSADPLFADAANGDYRPLAASPMIDAGAPDSLLGAIDPDGNPRLLGAAPDIGAFEWTGASPLGRPSSAVAAGGDDAGTAVAPTDSDGADDGADSTPAATAEQPIAGKSVGVAPASGTVKLREPGSAAFTTLRGGDAVPFGSTIDARQGAVRLVSVRDTAGTLQAGVFSKGMFRVTQAGDARAPLTVVTLVGGDFAHCARASAAGARTARAAGRSGDAGVVRELWGRDRRGRFRADGRYAAGTLRGTVWVTRDRCDGTLTRVVEGAVSVYDKRRHRRVLVRHGQSYLARAPR